MKTKKINPLWFGIVCGLISAAVLSLPLGLVPQSWLSVETRMPLLCLAGVLIALVVSRIEKRNQRLER